MEHTGNYEEDFMRRQDELMVRSTALDMAIKAAEPMLRATDDADRVQGPRIMRLAVAFEQYLRSGQAASVEVSP